MRMDGEVTEWLKEEAGKDDCGRLKTNIGGAVAQLGARLDGIEEVVGSNPIGSTILLNYLRLCYWLRHTICVVVCAITPRQTPARECIQDLALCFEGSLGR
jgi:hypothetical protein